MPCCVRKCLGLELHPAKRPNQGPSVRDATEPCIHGSIDCGLDLVGIAALQVSQRPASHRARSRLQGVAHDAPALGQLPRKGGAALAAEAADPLHQRPAERLSQECLDNRRILRRGRCSTRTTAAATGHATQSGADSLGPQSLRRQGAHDLRLGLLPIRLNALGGMPLERAQAVAVRLLHGTQQHPLVAQRKELPHAQVRLLLRCCAVASRQPPAAAAARGAGRRAQGEVGNLPVESLGLRTLQEPRGPGRAERGSAPARCDALVRLGTTARLAK
mmetsp:Transcript_116767/g.260811  ORF Transcript_116767/g.260811 Transcript_116767/m.260811 type:complete len:275 (+) Transcript_116767:510-1334(+)